MTTYIELKEADLQKRKKGVQAEKKKEPVKEVKKEVKKNKEKK